jgi:hypothetical protein
MTHTERDTLKVDVPVGFLLPASREILVSIDRASEAPLSIRLRLIPAEQDAAADLGATPFRSEHDTPMPVRRLKRKRPDDDYPGDDIGGSD